ncbi:DMT family transporter [Stutzerimonas kunmingensis]|uniref:DMT family transporter n=1 Tax=Stutzerimonas kunmingensis TaxID=1211807 RepID=UPI0028A931EF|nr:DMT family transporter [Stutzerimonas kunmingensis]
MVKSALGTTIYKISAKSITLTAIAMLAFAANSVLVRLALKETTIDAASFTLIRILSGALVLSLLLLVHAPRRRRRGSLGGAITLSIYAVAFSFAYIELDTGTGALLLFGAVQLSMFAYGIIQGERLRPVALIGLSLALIGILTILLPGASAPPAGSATLMIAAGVAWGIYSLLGKDETDPIAATAGNFVYAIPIVVIMCLPFMLGAKFDKAGTILAVLSGALASGLGYAVWYSAIRGLSAMQASTVQLSVPILAWLAGLVFLDETMATRTAFASSAVLVGIALVLGAKNGTACRRD